jgi:hypothetical protein
VNQDPSFHRRELAEVEYHYRQPVIGHQRSVRYQSLLVVSGSLHGSQNVFEVPPNTPSLWTARLGQPHRCENHQPFRRPPFHKRRCRTDSGSARVLRDREELRDWLAGIVCIALDDAIK